METEDVTHLHRIAPARNMARFYRISSTPSLFGDICLVREWGRIGFIVFLVLVAVANFAFLPLIHGMFEAMQAMVPADFLNSPQGLEMRVQLRVGLWTSLITAAAAVISGEDASAGGRQRLMRAGFSGP